jgi:SRSO17 transposase
VLGHVLRDRDAARDLCRECVLERLGVEDGVLIVDETGFLKRGEHPVGVARQYSGTAGRIENAQVGVFLACAGGKGHALVDRELYPPKREWCDDPSKRAETAIPEAVTFATKPALALLRMVGRALDAGLSRARVLGGEVYGSDRRLRVELERREQPFVLAVRGNEKLWAVPGKRLGQHAAARLAASLPPRAWRRLSAGAGSKGERSYDWARLRLTRLRQPPRDRWLLVRRSRTDPKDLACYVVFGPDRTTPAALARVAGRRRAIEECLPRGRQAGGRPRRPRDPLLARLAPTRHAGHARRPCSPWPSSPACG